MLGRVRLCWIGAWIKQDKLWMEQGHARGVGFTAVAAALSGCNGASPQLWAGRETILALRDSLEQRGQGMGLLGTGTRSRNLAGSGHCVSLGTKNGAAHGRNPSMSCSTRPSWKLSAPGRQGANTAKPKPSPTMPSLGFGGSMATGRGTPLPWQPGALPAAAPLCGGLADTAGKGQCHVWMCHQLPGPVLGQGAQLRDG